MLSKIFYGSFLIFLTWAVTVLALSLNSNITFGGGSGDLFYIILLGGVVLSLSAGLVLYITGRLQDVRWIYFFIGVMLITMTYFTLKFTLLRDGEYRWNGKVFYHRIEW
jgi:hypothetical protein